MTKLNRTIPPATENMDTFKPFVADKSKLSNDVPVYMIESGTEDIVKIDLQFRAGSWFQPKPLVAEATSDMLTEGTKDLTSAEIAHKLDFYGAFLRTSANRDIARITLITLNKHLEPVLEILADILKNPQFPEHEFKTYIDNKKQQFQLNRSKVNTLSRIKFNEAVFGAEHPYGKILQFEDHDRLTREDLVKFHKNHYVTSKCELLVTGKTGKDLISLIDKYLGDNSWAPDTQLTLPDFDVHPPDQKEIFTPKENAVQAAIRMGNLLFTKHHPDYLKMKIVTTILGGYFGSRLMKKVREEKGYTYGINAILLSLVNEGYFVIVSEVGSKVCRKAIDAIKQEIKLLKKEKVGQEELNMVKNYMMGELLRSFDGPFPTSSTYLSILETRISEDYFSKLFDEINKITATDVTELANKYLDEEKMVISIAGQCEE